MSIKVSTTVITMIIFIKVPVLKAGDITRTGMRTGNLSTHDSLPVKVLSHVEVTKLKVLTVGIPSIVLARVLSTSA